jgi:hypothetical protein
MEPRRKAWNQQQQVLRQSLTRPYDHPGSIQKPDQEAQFSDGVQRTVELFLDQHAMVHAAGMSPQAGRWSFEDEALQGLSGQQMRLTPPGCEHSIAWVIWHLTRIEDMTMNRLVADSPQILDREGWLERMEVRLRDTGNAMDPARMADLGAAINVQALRDYRLSVGRRTCAIARLLQPEEFGHKVDPARLEQLKAAGDVPAESGWLLEYWGGLTIAGLLLMPPTRHPFVHWNEALRIRKNLSKN